jgi:hypothetical protein
VDSLTCAGTFHGGKVTARSTRILQPDRPQPRSIAPNTGTGKESKDGHGHPWTPFLLNSLFPPCRLKSVGGNQISYQSRPLISVRPPM